MDIKALMMNKQIILALGMIVFVGAVVASGTGAFFSSQASATGNVFTAGTLDLAITRAQGGSNPEETKDAEWSFSNMAPGGDSVEESVWLRNIGSIEGASLAIDATIASGGGNQDRAKQMRIAAMTLDGSNLLEGGAGATIEEYQEPATCTVTATPGNLVSTVSGAADGSIVCVDSGSYNPGTLAVSGEDLTIVALHAPDGPDAANITGTIDVTGDGVTIRGLNLTNPSAGYGITVHGGAEGLTIADNIIHDIGTSLASGSAQAVSIQNGSAGGTGYAIIGNRISSVGNTNLVQGSSGSAKGIYMGDTGAAGVLDEVTIENNIIHTIAASGTPWPAGRGAYGIQTNVDAGTTNLVVQNNTIYDLDGLWSTAVGLERTTSGAIVRYNNIYDLVNHKVENDSNGVKVEDNPASGIKVQYNNLIAAYGVTHVTTGGSSVNAKFNWWGDFDPSDNVFTVGPTVNTADFAYGPIAGLVGGVDANGNGYADLHDLMTTGISGVTPGLDPYSGSNDKEFVMAVQLDASTDNSFQGESVTDVDIEFTLNQI